jgi:N5-(carboxyethyl)ornithine synthase
MQNPTLGVIWSSRKENEHRVPIHPDHIKQIPEELRARMVFEHGYGDAFSRTDADLLALGVSLASREKILAEAGIVLLAKPLVEDLNQIRVGGVLWGWAHCVQQRDIAQAAIDRELTLITWESMFLWRNEERDMHIFYRNNEMAGFCSVIHALACAGQDGFYGAPMKCAVLSFGSVSRGAIRALQGRGAQDITVYTQRPPWSVHNKLSGCQYAQMIIEGKGIMAIGEDGTRVPLAEILLGVDVIVNGILQDTDAPLMFLEEEHISQLQPGSLIVDTSCDEGMGFPFALPTTFEDPTFQVGNATYYGVDHSPSYLWRSASWELSRAVLPFLATILGGPNSWRQNETIRRATEIEGGKILNQEIIRFQGRS